MIMMIFLKMDNEKKVEEIFIYPERQWKHIKFSFDYPSRLLTYLMMIYCII
jgi:hypothetical protein